MKYKLLLSILLLFGMFHFASAQMMADFENGTTDSLTLHVMGNGDWDNDALHPVSQTFIVVDNPHVSGINTSSKVLKFTRRGTNNGGQSWGGFWASLSKSIDLTTNKYVHVKVWKPVVSPVKFKLEGGPSGTLEIFSKNTQDSTSQWVDMVFDFSSLTGKYPTVSLMPDFDDPFTRTNDTTIYIDDIQLTNDSVPITVASKNKFDINFEDSTNGPLTLHVMGNGDWDNDALHPVSQTFSIVNNPDPSGINTSNKVMKFIRRGTDNGGQPWGGFWADISDSADLTTNQYIHVEVYKPRISPIKFKFQGGAAGDLEIFSTNQQTITNGWQDMVFDFTSITGKYPICAFMPDFEDPLTITADQTIYFDNIVLNNDPNPRTTTGIPDHRSFDFNLYPNPVVNDLFLQLNTDLQKLIVYNIMGQKVLEMDQVRKGIVHVNIRDLTNGIYIMSLTDLNNRTSMKKFIKK